MEVHGETGRYWCHLCSQLVNPILEDELKCPFCQSGFVEEMGSASSAAAGIGESDFASDHALSLWAPILLGMMGNPRRRRRFRHHFPDDNNEEGDENGDGSGSSRERPLVPGVGEVVETSELDRELDSIITRRRRNSAAILQLLQGIRAGMSAEPPPPPNSEGDAGERERERERERLILINPFNQTVIIQGSYDFSQNANALGSLGEYITGPGGLDLLLQHLAENDPNRYGTPPAQKQVVETLPVVKVQSNLQCSVCLDDFELGAEAKEMPCKHKFHVGCILPWLEMHSSCPVCRYQLPIEDSKLDSEGSRGGNNEDHGEPFSGPGQPRAADMGERSTGSDRRFTLPWPLNTLFSSGTQTTTGGISSPVQSSSSGSSTTGAPGTASQTDDE
ncbi:hypothetical protein Dimus_011616 [Dionaea muscipula]